jgi:hypothetical protein
VNAGRDEGAVALAAAVSLAAAKRDLRTPRERGAMRGLCTRRKESNDLPIFAQRWRNANSHHAGVCLPAVSELPLRAPRFVNRQAGHSPVSWFKFRISGSCKGWRKEKRSTMVSSTEFPSSPGILPGSDYVNPVMRLFEIFCRCFVLWRLRDVGSGNSNCSFPWL